VGGGGARRKQLNSSEMGCIITGWRLGLSNAVHSIMAEFKNMVTKNFWFNGSRNILRESKSMFGKLECATCIVLLEQF
jgi:hypothetical protein